jgi:hypothetical protein
MAPCEFLLFSELKKTLKGEGLMMWKQAQCNVSPEELGVVSYNNSGSLH